VFIVWSDEVQVARGWRVAGKVNAGKQRWTVDGLADAATELFANHDSGLPPYGVPE
jgi:hypothetical protein